MDISHPTTRDNHLSALRTDDNITTLHEETLAVIAITMSMIGYVGFTFVVATPLGHNLSFDARPACLLLIVAATLTYALRKRQTLIAALSCAMGTFGAVALLVTATQHPVLNQLFVVPILFSSVLLRRRLVLATAILATAWVYINTVAAQASATIAIFTIALVTLTALVSMRNILLSLTWLSHAYHRASENEISLREQGAEMKRVMKRLDELATHLERTNQQLTFERNLAEEARQLKQQFAQTVSHELRTPLNLVVAFAELMAQSPELYGAPLPQRYMRDLAIIQRNAMHLQNLVNDVLDLAQIDAAQLALVLDKVQPESIVADAERTIRSLVEAQKLWLCVEVEPDLPAIMADAIRLRQVLINLLSNAVRFTPNGGITLRVTHDTDTRQVVFAVTDTGVGIKAADLPRLFHEFQQLDGSTRRKHGGTGLGLVISKRFVEMHNGQIMVESTPGTGSTFSFRIPSSQASSTPSPYLGEIAATRVKISSDRRSVLVVTRSQAPLNLFARHLENCSVLRAADLEVARNIAREAQPHAVVIDAALFGGGHAELQALLCDWSLTRATFMVCALPGEDALRRELDIESYLVKPITREGLAGVIQENTLMRGASWWSTTITILCN